MKFYDPSNKIAVNELVAGSIALNLGLPTPNKSLVNISTQVIEESQELISRQIRTTPHIGSEELAKEYDDFKKLGEEKLKNKQLINPEAFFGVVVFDNWVLNNDRNNPGNNMFAILHRDKMRYAVVDFSHCFTDYKWNLDALKSKQTQETLVGNFPFIQQRLSEPKKFEPWIKKVEKFDGDLIDEILNSIPDEWKFEEKEKAVMSEFLKTRKDIVRKVILKNEG